MDLGLRGKRAAVTGGSRGIGLAVGRALAQEGADVALVGRNAQAAVEQAALLAAETGVRVIGIGADTGDDASVTAMAEAAIEQLGGVDILVNNAARTNPGAKGVNVTVVHPGATSSETATKAFTAHAAARGVTLEEVHREVGATISIGRIVTPEEVAAVIAFLASPRSAALNGDPVIASGGTLGPIFY